MTINSTLPLDPERQELLGRLVEGLDPAALTWISGFAAGVALERSRGSFGATGAVAGAVRAVPEAPRAEAGAKATILYGSQTGNGRRIAERLARSAESAGLAVRLVSAADYQPRELANERLLYLILSTHGDGDPPDDVRALNDFVLGKRAPKLEKLSYSVLALGDSSYPKYCETGRAFDERLAALGARRLLSRVDADVDFEPLVAPWLEQALSTAKTEIGSSAPRLALVTSLRPAPAAVEVTRDNPVEAEVLANQRIVGRGAEREVRHLEIALPAGKLSYEPGDALGIWPENPPETVARIAELIGVAADTPVKADGREHSLQQWLSGSREITKLTKPFIEKHAERAHSEELHKILAPGQGEALRHLLKDLQVADLLRRYPATWEAEALVTALRPLTPRLYSIASSRAVVGDEVHLTVAVLDYEFDGERRYGSASRYCVTHGGEGEKLRVFVEPNPRFRLPADGSRDVIMIGPGTGVAPFRGFLQERVAAGASGRNWLFFGGRHLDSEFLYQIEWQEAVRRGELQRLDVAFSRDQSARIYVQQRMRERAADLYAWLQGGASLYVCGDAERMAHDVNTALIDVVEQQGALSREDAVDYVNTLAAEKRYLRDVY